MKKALLLVHALAVIPVGVDAQGTPSSSCEGLSAASPVEDLRPCAEQGNAYGQIFLGFMYDSGTGVPEADVEAVRWWRLAADQGLASAQYFLGLAYGQGRSVPEDHVLAYMWFNLAASTGHENAVKGRDTIAILMTPADLSAAQKLARECVAKNYKGC